MSRVLGPLLCALWLLPALAQERMVESVLPALAYGPKCSSTLELRNLSERSVTLEVEGHRSGGSLVPLVGHPSLTIRLSAAERVSYKLQLDEETTSAWAKVKEIVPSPRLTPVVAVSGTTECVVGDKLRSTAREPAYPIRNPWFSEDVSEISSEEILVINTSERPVTAWLCYSAGNLYSVPSETRPTQLTQLCSSEAAVQIAPFGTRQFPGQRDHNSYFLLKTQGNGIVLEMLRPLDDTVWLYKVDTTITFGHEEPD